MAASQIGELASFYYDDPLTLLTCTSLFAVVGEKEKASNTVKVILKCVNSRSSEIARGLKNLGYPREALTVLDGIDDSDNVLRIKAEASYALGEAKEALSSVERLTERTLSDDILLADILCLLKDYDGALKIAEEVASESADYESKKCLLNILAASGDRKNADRFVKNELKKNKDSPDANALSAHLMWIEGKIAAAAAYATKAIKIDTGHIGALETLAYCLIEKGELSRAQIIAGAINEEAPGHPCVIKIIDLCA